MFKQRKKPGWLRIAIILFYRYERWSRQETLKGAQLHSTYKYE